MTGRIGQAAVALWRSAPVWRGIVVAATVCTILAFVIPSRHAQPPPYPQPFPTPTPVPTPVPVPPPMAVEPPETQQRWALFMSSYVAGNAATPAAQRCELLARALLKIQPSDQSWLTPDRTKAQDDARPCVNEIEASDRRLGDLTLAAQQASHDEGVEATQRLAAAFGSLDIDFDPKRSLSQDQKDAVHAGELASKRIADSNRRIATLAQAGAGFSPASPAATYTVLVAAAQAIAPFDRGRMDESTLALLDQAHAASDRLRESDARLQELHSALGIAKTSSESQIRERLIAAVAKITDFDTGRGDTSFAQDAGEARGLARGYALDEVVAEARDFDPDTASPEKVARLAAMRSALGAVNDVSPEQREALKAADRSSVMLADSDRRLAALKAAADAWDKDPSPSTAPQVMDALAAATAFDRARFDQPHRQAMATLEAARQVIGLRESKGTVTLAALKELPVFVTGSPGNDAASYVRLFQDALRADGFRLAPSRESAALAMELDGAVLGGQRIGEGLVTSRVDLALNAVWVYDGRGFRQDKQSAISRGGSEQIAAERAYREAADGLYKNFIGALQASDPGGQK